LNENISPGPDSVSHKDRLTALLDEAGIGYIRYQLKDDKGWDTTPDGNVLKIREGYEGVEGYPWFYCTFHFDEEGQLQKVGCWE
jgi:hypothetical protein